MRALLRVELTRLRWRRAVLLLLLASVVVPAVIAVATIWNTRPPSAEELASINEQVAAERERPEVQRDLQECLEHPDEWGISQGEDVQATCERYVLPQPDWFSSYTPLDLREQLEGSGLGVVTVIALLLMLAGTSFIGHDWTSGSMSNQLLFESRRGRIWSAKALVVTAVAFATSAVVSAAYWLVLWAVARSRDLPSGDGLLRDSLELGLRGAVLAAGAALAGFAMTMLFRSTVATIGILFALSVGAGLVIAVLGLDGRWQPTTNLEAFVADGATYYVDTPSRCYDGSNQEYDPVCNGERELSLTHGAVYYGVLLAGASVASAASFRRRDVP